MAIALAAGSLPAGFLAASSCCLSDVTADVDLVAKGAGVLLPMGIYGVGGTSSKTDP